MKLDKEILKEEIRKSKRLMEFSLNKPKETELDEKSYSRIWKHINSDKSFAIVSAYLTTRKDSENKEKHEQLREMIRNLRYGYNELNSGYTYVDDNINGKKSVEERSFFVPNMRKQEALTLGKIMDQESIIYKDADEFVVLDCETGKILNNFKRGGNDDYTFNPEKTQHAFSQFGNNKNKSQQNKFTFNVDDTK